MSSYTQPGVPPEEEFPSDPLFLRDWKSIYLDTIRGRATLPRKHDLNSLVSRMHRLHVSKIRWYSTNVPLESSGERLKTFELASGSQWDASPALQPRAGATTSQDLGQDGATPYHQHHYMTAEISLPTPDALVHLTPTASTTSSVSAQLPSSSPLNQGMVLGYLRIEGTCRSDSIMVPSSGSSVAASVDRYQTLLDPLILPSANTSSSQIQQPTPRPHGAWTNRQGNAHHATSLDSELHRTLSELFIPSSQEALMGGDVATPSHSGDVDATPVTRRYRRSLIEQTPTRSHPHENVEDSSRPYGASFPSGEDNAAALYASQPQGSSSGAPAAPTDIEEPSSLSSLPTWTDRFGRPDLDKASSPSPLFISPFASRSNSVTRSRASTDTTRSQTDTRPNSRSNSSSNSPPPSNATSFTTSSSFSLSSAGLVFSNDPLDHPDSSRLSGDGARFIVTYLEGAQTIEEAQAAGDDECVLELSFPVNKATTPNDPGSPQSFFTFRDLTILADLVEHSLKEKERESEMEARDLSMADSASDSAASDVSDESTGPSEMSMFAPNVSTCCCEFFKRLVNVVPLVSGLRVVSGSSMSALGNEEVDTSLHYDDFSHHGRYLRTPFGDEGSSDEGLGVDTTPALANGLKGQFERRKARCDRKLLSAARSEPRSWTSQAGASSVSSSSSFSMGGSADPPNFVPALALEEARIATERFLRAVREVEEVRSSTASSDEEP
ncbi:hypothetical protein EST38_g4265 [Candolleomyces aberdarensis]|uniref:Uncharacterized protein n=1 Tax=Candolleomyces aberdarensis TaxID=2316362 RepID=A0A4Q2DQ32_9AGAR|nr:hypothetical protein EST38_g4265 [Candolleomyces aberdarensis]